MENIQLLQLTQTAIKFAISQKWNEAVLVNLQILKANPRNVDALNRLGTAYINLAECSKAKSCFTKAIKIDPLNNIANKNLKILKSKKATHQIVVPEKYNLKGTIKEPDKNNRQKTKPYIRHTGLEDDESTVSDADFEGSGDSPDTADTSDE